MKKIERELQKLWADFGKLSEQQEILQLQLQQTIKQKRNIYAQIRKLEQPQEKEDEQGKEN